jgi:2-iminobutanoate/2-iminopropanoate deaminase
MKKFRFRTTAALAALSISMVFLTPAFSGQASTQRKYFALNDALPPSPFSPAILAGGTLYVSGMVATDPVTGKFIEGDISAQAERVIGNIELVLKKAGFDLSQVVSTTVFITDLKEFAAFNAVFRMHFPKNPPTRATVQVVALAMNAKIEISAIAVK